MSSRRGRGGSRAGSKPARPRGQSVIQYFTPSYSLYPVLADIHGADRNAVPLSPGFGLPTVADLKRGGRWHFDAALTLVTTPNAPTGCGYPVASLDALCAAQRGVVVLDEAYVDFAAEHALSLALRHPHVLVARTFSKAYSLCFQRVGYAVGAPDLIAALHKIKDSYNVNGLGQVAALATLDDLDYYRANFARVRATRDRLCDRLSALGFEVTPSQTNFIFCRPPRFTAEAWLGRLRERRVLVRWFGAPEVKDYLRITVGADPEADALLRAARTILRRARRFRTDHRLRGGLAAGRSLQAISSSFPICAPPRIGEVFLADSGRITDCGGGWLLDAVCKPSPLPSPSALRPESVRFSSQIQDGSQIAGGAGGWTQSASHLLFLPHLRSAPNR